MGSFSCTLRLFLSCDFGNIFWISAWYCFIIFYEEITVFLDLSVVYISGSCLWTRFFFFFNNWELLDYNIHLKWCKKTGRKINWLRRVLLFDNGAEADTELCKRNQYDKIWYETSGSWALAKHDPYQTTKLNVKHLHFQDSKRFFFKTSKWTC